MKLSSWGIMIDVKLNWEAHVVKVSPHNLCNSTLYTSCLIIIIETFKMIKLECPVSLFWSVVHRTDLPCSDKRALTKFLKILSENDSKNCSFEALPVVERL